MNDEQAGGNDCAEDLQYQQADYDDSAVTDAKCGTCAQTIVDSYYEVNGTITCARCCERLQATLSSGSPILRTLTATVAGTVAGAVGAGIYYGITAATGWQIGLVTIVVGILVGGAVRWGARGRSGWFYQSLAMLLAYLSIGAAHSIFIIQALEEGPPYLEEQPPVATQPGATTQPAPSTQSVATAPSLAPASRPAAATQPSEVEQFFDGLPGPVRFLVACGMLLAFFVVAPVLMAFASPLSGLIDAFALYQAWRMNKRRKHEVTGPYSIVSEADSPYHAPPEDGPPEDHADV